eukprot:g33078.t1
MCYPFSQILCALLAVRKVWRRFLISDTRRNRLFKVTKSFQVFEASTIYDEAQDAAMGDQKGFDSPPESFDEGDGMEGGEGEGEGEGVDRVSLQSFDKVQHISRWYREG